MSSGHRPSLAEALEGWQAESDKYQNPPPCPHTTGVAGLVNSMRDYDLLLIGAFLHLPGDIERKLPRLAEMSPISTNPLEKQLWIAMFKDCLACQKTLAEAVTARMWEITNQP